MTTSANNRIPWYEPAFADADIDAVRETVASTFVNEGPQNRAFEEALCTYFNVPYARTTPNCTTALTLALMAAGIGHGDTVLVPDVTFIGTASAVRLAGAEPILVDIQPDTFTMDPADAAARLLPTTRAVVPVHLDGRSADLGNINALARQHDLRIIEDAAEAMGSTNEDGFLGTLSDAGCFSLAPTKIITSGQGGFVLTHSKDIFEQIIRLKDHGRLSRQSDRHPVTGFNFKLTDMQAALALAQFRRLPERIERARDIDNTYQEGLSGVGDIQFPPRPEGDGYLMWPDFTSEKRDALVTYMKERDIHLRPFWPALHTQDAYRVDDAFPGAKTACATACWLPCSPHITDAQIERVIDTVQGFFAAQRRS